MKKNSGSITTILLVIFAIVFITGVTYFQHQSTHYPPPLTIPPTNSTLEPANTPLATNEAPTQTTATTPATSQPVVLPQQSQIIATTGTMGTVIPATLPGVGADAIFGNTDTQTASFVDLTKNGMNLIRFVPGTTANYWHWQGNGLGVLTSEINRDGAGTTKAAEASWTTSATYRYYDRYVSLVQATGSSALVSLNVLTQIAPSATRFDQASINLAINENLGLVGDLLSKGVRIVGVQLGNELHIGGYQDLFPTVTEYINRVKPIALAIRSTYPSVPIIVQPSPPEKTGKRIDEWNTALQKETFFDGVLLYEWLRPEDTGCMTGEITSQFNCINIASEKFIDSEVPPSLEAARIQFPGKSIWIGQWNLTAVNYNGANPPLTFDNSMVQALHAADFLMSIAKYDGVHDGVVKTASLMNFGGGKTLRNMVGVFQGGADSGTVTSNDGIVGRANYQAYAMLHSVFDGTHSMLTGSYSFPSATSDMRVYGTKSSKDTTFIIINRGASTFPLSSLTLNGVSALGQSQTVTVEFLYGSALSSTYGVSGSTAPWTPIVHTTGVSSSVNSITIKPYSVARITF